MRIEEGFQQITYEEPNPYTSDLVIPRLLERYFSESHFGTIDTDLTRFGDRISTEIREISGLTSPPALTQYDHLGRRIDRLTTSEGWRRLIAIFQEEGIVAIPHERPFGALSRVFAFAKVILAAGDAQVVFCPLSMTDGAARVIQISGTPEMKRDTLPRLISRDPANAWTAGQWMTERPGGSDLSQTETVAVSERSGALADAPGASYTLDGFKWFSSAPDGDISLALARSPTSPASNALSLFLVPLRPSLAQNGIRIHRLKNKGGTHALPTAELSLSGTPASLVGVRGKGIRAAGPLLAITRLHSASASVGYLRRALAIASAYARVRQVHGRALAEMPVHVATLAEPALTYAGLAQLLFGTAVLLGRTECGEASADEEKRLRVLTPVVKAFCARRAGDATVACMEALGGLGYMEESGIPRLIRDGLVERIWEGTITILALDLVRATSDASALNAFISWLRTASSPSHILLSLHAGIETTALLVHRAADILAHALGPPRSSRINSNNGKSKNDGTSEHAHKKASYARAALSLAGYAATAAFLLEHAEWASTRSTNDVADAEARMAAARVARWAYAPAGGLEGAIRLMEHALRDYESNPVGGNGEAAVKRGRESEDLAVVFGSDVCRRTAKAATTDARDRHVSAKL